MGVLKLKDGQNWIPIKTIKGDSGVYVGDTEPDPSDYNVWIDPEGEDDTPQLINKADVITDSASGSIVSISDGMASPVLGLSVDIEPIQDLHGYDNPWPAGGGKNLCPDSYSEFLLGTTYKYAKLSNDPYIMSFVDKDTSVDINGCSIGFMNNYPDENSPYNWAIASGVIQPNTTNFKSGVYCDTIIIYPRTEEAFNKLFSRFYIQVERGTSATPYAPYSNICPISGRSDAKVTRTGKNLLQNGIIPSSNLNPFTFASSQFFKEGAYTLSFQSTTATSWRYFVRGFDSSGNILPEGFMTGSGMTFRSDFYGYLSGANITNLSRQITLNKDCNLVFGLVLGDVTDQTTITGAQLELGSTASSYEPYNGQTVTIQLGQTVYGGTVDVTSGKLVIDRKYVKVGSSGWDYYSPYIYRTYDDKAKPTIASSEYPLMCSSLPYDGVKYASQFSNVCIAQSANKNVYIKDTSCASSSDYYTKYSDAEIMYELATPVEVTLTPQELEMFFGDNNIWSDASSVSCTYRADTQKWLEKKFAEIQALILQH